MGNDLFEAEQNVFCLNKKRKGKEGMKLHKPAALTGRTLSVLLAGAVSFCGLAVPAAAADSENDRSYIVSAQPIEDVYDLPEQYPADSGTVRVQNMKTARVLIEFTDPCVMEIMEGKDWDPADPDIIALREDIRRRQDEHVRQIERQIQNDKPLDILTRLDLSASAVSVEVQTSQIENIQSLDFVRQVTVEQKIYPAEDTQPADLGSAQTGGTNGEVTGINDEALNEESGQGTRIAVLDTGLNASHEVFNSDCFHESLSRKAQQNHMNAADYKASLDLMESSDIEAVMSSLHLQDGDKSSANLNRLYISDKIPFQYNYADGTIDASHALGNIDHGSHVTGIIAANSLIKKGNSFIESQYMRGYASDAQILVMKVFGQNANGSESTLFAAIEDAITLDCDVINMSLSSNSAGFGTSSDPRYQNILDHLKEKDVVICAASSNSGNWADSTNLNGKLKPGDISFSTDGSPGTYTNTLAVAASDPDSFQTDQSGKTSVRMNAASFSSWGIPETLELKPEVSAPGVMILSSNGESSNAGYDYRAGTSMATPAVAGMAGILSHWINEQDLTTKLGRSKRFLQNSLLMSTAIPMKDEDGNYLPVLQQGAGEVRIDQAVHGKLLISMDPSATDSAEDGKVKIELKDDKDRTGSYLSRIYLEGIEKTSDIHFKVEKHLFTQKVDEHGNLLKTTRPMDLEADTQANQVYTLKNGAKSGFNLTYALSAAEKERLNRETPKGAYIEGYVTIRPCSSAGTYLENETVYSIPILGFFGDWEEPGIFENVSLYSSAKDPDETAYVVKRDPDGRIHTNMLKISSTSTKKSRYLAGNPYVVEEGTEDKSRSAMNSDQTFVDVTFSSVRNISGLRHMIFTADGQLMLNNQDGTYSVNLSKPYTTLNGTQTNWNDQTHTQRLVNTTMTNGLAENTPYVFTTAAITEYTEGGNVLKLQEKALNGTLKPGMKLEFPFTLDNEAPQLQSAQASSDEIQLRVRDNRYAAAGALVDQNGKTTAIAAPDTAAEPGQTQTITLPAEHLSEGSYTVVIGDYARNETAYRLTVSRAANIFYNLTHVHIASKNQQEDGSCRIVLEADTSYTLPTGVRLKKNNVSVPSDQYAYDPSTGEIVLLPSLLTEGELTLEAEGVLDVMDLQLEGDAVSWPQEQTAIRNADFAMQVQAKNGYKLPSQISVYMDSRLLDSTAYAYASQTGKLTIPADQMSGHALRIVIHAVKDGVGEISLSPDSLKHCSLRIHGEHETGRDCVMNLEAEDGWALPKTITVTIEGALAPLNAGVDYVYAREGKTIILLGRYVSERNVQIEVQPIYVELLKEAVNKTEQLNPADFSSSLDSLQKLAEQARSLVLKPESQTDTNEKARQLLQSLLSLRKTPDASQLDALKRQAA